MYLEKVLKREDGTQYKLTATFSTDMWRRDMKPEYVVTVTTRQTGKRKWRALPSSIGFYTRRQTSPQNLKKSDMQDALKYVTKKEIEQVKIELWEKLHPKFWED